MTQCISKMGKIQCELQEHESGDHAIVDDKGVPLATWSSGKKQKKEGAPWTRR